MQVRMFSQRHIALVWVSAFLVTRASAAFLSPSFADGVCLCVNEPNVKAIRDPRNPSTAFVTLSNGDCFYSNGGIYHSNGNTWYELRDIENGQIAWVDSFYLSIHLLTTCNGSAQVAQASHHTPSGAAANCTVNGKTYAHGEHFLLHDLYCTCDDGISACSASGHHCFSGGIVYREGSAFDLPGSGSGCSCKQGAINCQSYVG